MASINSVTISGNLTREPEMRQTNGGLPILALGVAVEDRVHNQATGQWENRANYIDVSIFGKYASAIAPYLVKGQRVTIHGKLRYYSWEKDGQTRSKIEVVGDTVEIGKPLQGKAQCSTPTPPRQGNTISKIIPNLITTMTSR